MMQDGAGNSIGAFREGDGTDIQTIYQGGGNIIWTDFSVYLEDDWGDNKIADRDDSESGAHNNVIGVFRPEYVIENGTPTAENETLALSDEDVLHTDINLNLDKKVVWEWSDVDISDNPSNTSETYLTCWSESTIFDFDFPRGFEESYGVIINDTPEARLTYIDENGGGNTLINRSVSEVVQIRVERDDNGNWEMFLDGESVGTATDNNLSDPQFFGFISHDRETIIDSYVVN